MARIKFAQISDIHMTGFTVQDGLVCPRLPAYAWWATSRRYDLMGYLLPIALGQVQEQFQPQFVAFTGDQAEDGFSKFGKPDLELAKRVAEEHCHVPAHFVYGNHDGPQAQWADIYGSLDYSFDVEGARFVVLNTGSMDRSKEQESSAAALECLRGALKTAGQRRVIVLCHQWISPTDVDGYSMARAETVLAELQADPRVVAVINGHYHAGKYSETAGLHHCTAKSFCEPPMCYSTYELTPTELVWTEHRLSTKDKAFVAGETRRLPLRGG